MLAVTELAEIAGVPERRARYALARMGAKPVRKAGRRLGLYVVDLPSFVVECRLKQKPGPRPRGRGIAGPAPG